MEEETTKQEQPQLQDSSAASEISDFIAKSRAESSSNEDRKPKHDHFSEKAQIAANAIVPISPQKRVWVQSKNENARRGRDNQLNALIVANRVVKRLNPQDLCGHLLLKQARLPVPPPRRQVSQSFYILMKLSPDFLKTICQLKKYSYC